MSPQLSLDRPRTCFRSIGRIASAPESNICSTISAPLLQGEDSGCISWTHPATSASVVISAKAKLGLLWRKGVVVAPPAASAARRRIGKESRHSCLADGASQGWALCDSNTLVPEVNKLGWYSDFHIACAAREQRATLLTRHAAYAEVGVESADTQGQHGYKCTQVPPPCGGASRWRALEAASLRRRATRAHAARGEIRTLGRVEATVAEVGFARPTSCTPPHVRQEPSKNGAPDGVARRPQ